MAKISLSESEKKKLAAVSVELDGAIDDFFADVRDNLSAEQWEVLRSYAGASVRRALEVGVLLHALVDSEEEACIPYPGRGRETFVRAGLDAWRDSFAPVPEVWRLCPIFEQVPGGERRILADIAALEIMAANRMFASLDDQFEAFFATDG